MNYSKVEVKRCGIDTIYRSGGLFASDCEKVIRELKWNESIVLFDRYEPDYKLIVDKIIDGEQYQLSVKIGQYIRLVLDVNYQVLIAAIKEPGKIYDMACNKPVVSVAENLVGKIKPVYKVGDLLQDIASY